MVLVENSKFLNFSFLFKIGREKSFYDVLDKKQPFIDHENISFRKSKYFHFS